MTFDFWALTPICDPRLPAHGPEDRSCLGLSLLQGLPDACLRIQSGSTPIASSTSGIPRHSISVAYRALQSAHGFAADCSPVPFSVLMGPMPGLT
jgi:hypothetical protein